MGKLLYAYFRPHGMSREDVERLGRDWGIEAFDEHSHEFFVDVAPRRARKGVDHAPSRTFLLERALSKNRRDIVGVPRADMLGRDYADVDGARHLILRGGHSIVELSTGLLVEPIGKVTVSDDFMANARRAFQAGAVRALRAGRERSGRLGGAPKRWSLEQKLAAMPAWLDPGRHSIPEREKLAGVLAGRPTVPQSNMRRWYDCEPGAGEIGRHADPEVREAVKVKSKLKVKR